MRSTICHSARVALVACCLAGCAAPGAARRSLFRAGPMFVKHVIDDGLPAISATALDVDGDGRLDVVAAGGPNGGASEWSNLIYWYRAPGWQKELVRALEQGEAKADKVVLLHIEACDFIAGPGQGDASASVPQVCAADGKQGDVWWLRYDRAAGAWAASAIVTNASGVHGTANGDIDGDGYDDVLVPTQRGEPKGGLIWARNPGRGPARETTPWQRFPLADSFDISGWQHYVRLRDVNGDDRLDALLGSGGDPGWFGFWLQGEDARRPWEAHVLAGETRKGTNLDAADLNGDGRTDLVGTEGHGTGIWWFPAPDYEATCVDDTLESAHCLALGDMDGDGSCDIVSCGFVSKTVACFLNDGEGNFRKVQIDGDQEAYDAVAVDLDEDGDLDILLAGRQSGNVVWYENRTRR